jgi:hypothetical protein
LNATVTSRLPGATVSFNAKCLQVSPHSSTVPYTNYPTSKQFLPEAGKLQLRSTLSVNALYNRILFVCVYERLTKFSATLSDSKMFYFRICYAASRRTSKGNKDTKGFMKGRKG